MKERWYYPHEEVFFWLVTVVTFFAAWGLGGVFFIAMIFAGFPFWAAIYIFWWLFARRADA